MNINSDSVRELQVLIQMDNLEKELTELEITTKTLLGRLSKITSSYPSITISDDKSKEIILCELADDIRGKTRRLEVLQGELTNAIAGLEI